MNTWDPAFATCDAPEAEFDEEEDQKARVIESTSGLEVQDPMKLPKVVEWDSWICTPDEERAANPWLRQGLAPPVNVLHRVRRRDLDRLVPLGPTVAAAEVKTMTYGDLIFGEGAKARNPGSVAHGKGTWAREGHRRLAASSMVRPHAADVVAWGLDGLGDAEHAMEDVEARAQMTGWTGGGRQRLADNTPRRFDDLAEAEIAIGGGPNGARALAKVKKQHDALLREEEEDEEEDDDDDWTLERAEILRAAKEDVGHEIAWMCELQDEPPKAKESMLLPPLFVPIKSDTARQRLEIAHRRLRQAPALAVKRMALPPRCVASEMIALLSSEASKKLQEDCTEWIPPHSLWSYSVGASPSEAIQTAHLLNLLPTSEPSKPSPPSEPPSKPKAPFSSSSSSSPNTAVHLGSLLRAVSSPLVVAVWLERHGPGSSTAIARDLIRRCVLSLRGFSDVLLTNGIADARLRDATAALVSAVQASLSNLMPPTSS